MSLALNSVPDAVRVEREQFVVKREAWYRLPSGKVSEPCSRCGLCTAIVHETEIKGLPRTLVCYCVKCAPVVFI